MADAPSVQTTLDALRTIFAAALPGVTVEQTDSVPLSGVCPVLLIYPMEDILSREFTGMEGNPDGQPNQYSLVYLQRPYRQQEATLATVRAAVLADMEKLKGVFKSVPNQTLQVDGVPQVLFAAQKLRILYNWQGPYITFAEQNWIGCRAILDVQELFRPDDDD